MKAHSKPQEFSSNSCLSLPTAVFGLWLICQLAAAAEPSPHFSEKPLAEAECSQALDLDWTALEMDFKPERGLIHGKFQTVVQNHSAQPINQICFLLNPGLKIQQLELLGISQALKTPTAGNAPLVYRIKLKQALAPGQNQHLAIDYTGKVSSVPKFGRIQPDDLFLTAQTGFYPRFERASHRRCPMELLLHVPKGYLAIPSGTMTEQKNGELHTALETICGLQNDFGFDLIAGRYSLFTAPPVRIFYRGEADPNQLTGLASEFRGFLDALEKQFGRHSFARFNLVETNRDDLGGMAKTNTVFLSNKYFGDPAKVAPAQYSYFKQQLKSTDAAQVSAEFDFYRRSVLAHEMAHLFLNYFYDYDQPWAAEGLPEFVSLKVLADRGLKADVERKLAAYRQIWQQVPQRPLPALNQAQLDSQFGYLVNYQGTPLVLNQLTQSRGELFWKNWRTWLTDRQHPLRYEELKASLNLTPAEAALFEKAFDPKGL